MTTAQDVISALKDRAESLEEKQELIKERDEFHTEEETVTKFSPIHSDETLNALRYEISRLERLREKDRLAQKNEDGIEDLFEGIEDPETVTAELKLKDVTGSRRSKEFDLVYDSADESSGERLRRFNDKIRKELTEDTWFKHFESDVKCDKVVSYTVTRVRETDGETLSDR